VHSRLFTVNGIYINYLLLTPPPRTTTAAVVVVVVLVVAVVVDRDLMEEIVPLMKEAIDRKAENPRRKKRRDVLRLSLLRIFLYMANNGIFARWYHNIIYCFRVVCPVGARTQKTQKRQI